MDPRTSIIDTRLHHIKRIIAVVSGKGGVGKSMVSCGLALNLVQQGYHVGLLDLDLYGPSSHIILGATNVFPEEKNGLIPPKVHNIQFMSLVYFSEDKPAPFRGDDITNIILELFTITKWENLDYLIIDMPPGLGEETLDIIRYVKQAEFLVVTTPSKVALGAVTKVITLLQELKRPVLGVIENMHMPSSPPIKQEITALNATYLGALPFDEHLETTIGKPEQIITTQFMKHLQDISTKISF